MRTKSVFRLRKRLETVNLEKISSNSLVLIRKWLISKILVAKSCSLYVEESIAKSEVVQ